MELISHFTKDSSTFWCVDSVEKTNTDFNISGWVGNFYYKIKSLQVGDVKIDSFTDRGDVLESYNFQTNELGFNIKVPISDIGLPVYVETEDSFKLELGTFDKWAAYYSGFKPGNITKDIIVVENFYQDPDLVREVAMNQLDFSPSDYHKGERATTRFVLDGTKEKLESIIGKEITNWNHASYANGIFQFCTADQPIVYHVDSQTYAGVVFLTPDAPPESGTSFFRSKFTGEYKYAGEARDTQSYVDCFKGNSDNMNFYDSTNFEKIDEIGNVYNRLALWDASTIHAASTYFGDAIHNARFFHMFFFDLKD